MILPLSQKDRPSDAPQQIAQEERIRMLCNVFVPGPCLDIPSHTVSQDAPKDHLLPD